LNFSSLKKKKKEKEKEKEKKKIFEKRYFSVWSIDKGWARRYSIGRRAGKTSGAETSGKKRGKVTKKTKKKIPKISLQIPACLS
jgi:hypothetical protein